MLKGYELGVALHTKPVTFTGLVELMSSLKRYWLEIVPASTPSGGIGTMPTRIADPLHRFIFLIEDDEDDYILTREFLEDIFINQFVLRGNTPEKARDVMAQNRHDLCLMDFHLGPSDGIELLKHARSVGFLAPVIMLTGQEDLQTDAMALRHGAVDYLSSRI